MTPAQRTAALVATGALLIGLMGSADTSRGPTVGVRVPRIHSGGGRPADAAHPGRPARAATATRPARPAGTWNHTDADKAAWAKSRLAMLLAQLASVSPPILAETARTMALQLLAHLSRETWYGEAEWNGNVGNIRSAYWAGDWFNQRGEDDPAAGGSYRSYRTPDLGVKDYVHAVSGWSRYVPSFRWLRANPTNGVDWYEKLIRAGYSTNDEPHVAEARREFPQYYARNAVLLRT